MNKSNNNSFIRMIKRKMINLDLKYKNYYSSYVGLTIEFGRYKFDHLMSFWSDASYSVYYKTGKRGMRVVLTGLNNSKNDLRKLL